MAIAFDTRTGALTPALTPAVTPALTPAPPVRHLSLVPPLAARPVTAAAYWRRRLVALALLVALVAAVVWAVAALLSGPLAVGPVSADRGGVPATASAVGPVAGPAPVSALLPSAHVAMPGDTMWSIAERYRGPVSVRSYVDALVALNGGVTIQAGQLVQLPEPG
jgi:hypothetical protein